MRGITQRSAWLLAILVSLTACGGGGGGDGGESSDASETSTEVSTPTASPVADGEYRVLAFNDLGMHCMDREYSVYSILPPYNVVNAQVIRQGAEPEQLSSDQVEVRYAAIPDATGSINSSSSAKTDFWQYAKALFGQDLQLGEGLKGLFMPADHPTNPGPQPLTYHADQQWFSAEGIPITPLDDTNWRNPYALLRISAHDKQTGVQLAFTDVVTPVSQETDCQNCHASGQRAAQNPGVAWSSATDLEIQSKQNVLLLHDHEFSTQLAQSTPVLCASCHYSAALDLNGQGPTSEQAKHATLSRALHRAHAFLDDEAQTVEATCYQCHPGKDTQCQRGAMREGGMECLECHGGMRAVAGEFPLLAGGSVDGANDFQSRRPWMDMPRCQSCHTGDAVDHLAASDLRLSDDGIRLRQTHRVNDPSASPIQAENRRFAENVGKLFRFSKGHGEVACEGCHGSTHAIWPNADAAANDNVAARQLQGHSGTVIECDTCHGVNTLPLTTDGPHGMHNVNNARWADGGHERFYERNPNACRACHGTDLRGTPLSKMAVTRTFHTEKGSVTLAEGEFVGCGHCHGIPR